MHEKTRDGVSLLQDAITMKRKNVVKALVASGAAAALDASQRAAMQTLLSVPDENSAEPHEGARDGCIATGAPSSPHGAQY
jgi:hypothetical protein